MKDVFRGEFNGNIIHIPREKVVLVIEYAATGPQEAYVEVELVNNKKVFKHDLAKKFMEWWNADERE